MIASVDLTIIYLLINILLVISIFQFVEIVRNGHGFVYIH